MGKKKRGHPDLEELLARPWCYYCERDFDDLKILISHQKAKHFKCERCGRRLNTAGGLSVHMSQVHKEQLSEVDNALPNRTSLDIEIFGMEGVPEDIVQAHNQRVLTQFQQAEAERRAATGNPPPGAAKDGGQAKKPKLEISDLKKRLAEHKAKVASEKSTEGSSGNVTPMGAGQSASQPQTGFGENFPHPPAQQPASNVPNTQYSYPPSYGTATPSYQHTPSPVYQNHAPNGQQQVPPLQHYGVSQYASPPQFQAGQTPPPYATTVSPHPFVQQQQQPARTHTPPQSLPQYPPRPGSLPAAPGLPQRPSFGGPQINSQPLPPMQHPLPGVPSPGVPPAYGQYPALAEVSVPASSATPLSNSVDELISGAAKTAEAQAAPSPAEKPVPTEEKKAKKEKDKSKIRLVYSDNETSPEEKMATLPRYAYTPPHGADTVLSDATVPAVARPTTNSDDVIDASG
ncbi:hypothetical protein UA08_05429 [Talaromyces atroroseus]|uniref:C2H2-type domain-containing protein n=1 Tax=Talaromyces atroroseus TaxID=1441469 RepID=A0A225AWU1_TALAT|nr:hypothetical protein UA08_05429 [Talaromyces atroroseus]OKL59436.1 hypothetical protein UA08_05429 [Talaromyces atroroseus]